MVIQDKYNTESTPLNFTRIVANEGGSLKKSSYFIIINLISKGIKPTTVLH